MAQSLKEIFDLSQANPSSQSKISLTEDETNKFKKAFDDPEFRKLFAEYLDDMQKPENRQETEAYISQLEQENKVPEGKELIRPTGCFVAKTKKTSPDNDKIFINIVCSDKILAPTMSPSASGDAWSLPYSLGPPHMEKDKSGSNAVAFDCCFHPNIQSLSTDLRFQKVVVLTSIEGIEEFYRRNNQKVEISKEFHIVKGLVYKSGSIPSMLIATSSKNNWNPSSEAQNIKATPANKVTSKNETSSSTTVHSKPGPAVKKGFLVSEPKSSFKAAEVSSPPNPLIKELKTQDKTDVVKPTPVPSTEPVTPIFTVLERGLVGLGDFEALKGKIASNRPKEIIYKISLPLVDKPSKIELDVAERALTLKYSDIYALSIALPYPVFDKRGSAKYEKTSKSLVVTLPVQPRSELDAKTQLPSDSVELPTETEAEEQEDLSSKSNNTSTPKILNESSARHARWVAAPSSESNDLSEKIKMEADMAQRAYAASLLSASSGNELVPCDSNEPTLPSETAPAVINADLNIASFIACESYSGRRSGYAFKNGSSGLGYYLDPKQQTAVQPSETKAPPSVTSAFPFAFRQTKTTLAILIEVPNIVSQSVSIAYGRHSIEVCFDAGGNNFLSSYSAGFDLAGEIDCDACRHDVSAGNMVVVLTKAASSSELWDESSGPALSLRTIRDAANSKPKQASISLDGALEEEKTSEPSTTFQKTDNAIHAHDLKFSWNGLFKLD